MDEDTGEIPQFVGGSYGYGMSINNTIVPSDGYGLSASQHSVHLITGPDSTAKFKADPKGCSITLDKETMTFYAEQRDELERLFMMQLWENPKDDLTRAAYSDWLEEHYRLDTANLVRSGWTFGVCK